MATERLRSARFMSAIGRFSCGRWGFQGEPGMLLATRPPRDMRIAPVTAPTRATIAWTATSVAHPFVMREEPRGASSAGWTPFEAVAAVALGLVVAVGAVVWLGAAAAARVTGSHL